MRKTIELHKRWRDDPAKGEVFTPEELVKEMLDKIPTSVWENPTSTFLDPCMGKGTFLIDILRRLTTIYGYSVEDAMSRIYGYDVRVKYINYLKRGGFKNVFHKDFLSEKIDMKFDVVVGNPPYQDGSKNGGQNKLYMEFCKKSINLLKDDGKLTFVTPVSVLMPSKRFTLIGNKNLSFVNFDAANYFNVGVNICSWIIDKESNIDLVSVKSDGVIFKKSINESLHNNSNIDNYYIDIYEKVMGLTKSQKNINKRMFQRNNHGPAFSKNMTDEHIYEIHSVARGVSKITYTKRVPVFNGENKVIVSNTKALNRENIIISTDNYGPSYFAIPVENELQTNNVLSFVLSPFFINLYQIFRNIRGGMNSVLIDYCPIFDINKNWDNENVKNFFENL